MKDLIIGLSVKEAHLLKPTQCGSVFGGVQEECRRQKGSAHVHFNSKALLLRAGAAHAFQFEGAALWFHTQTALCFYMGVITCQTRFGCAGAAHAFCVGRVLCRTLLGVVRVLSFCDAFLCGRCPGISGDDIPKC